MVGQLRVGLPCAILALCSIAGCSDATAPSGPFSGRWAGTPPNYPELEFSLTQRDSELTGSGTITLTYPAPYTQPMLVIGTDFRTTLALTFSAENTIPAIFRGSLSANGDTLVGRLQVWGASSDTAAAFHRVP